MSRWRTTRRAWAYQAVNNARRARGLRPLRPRELNRMTLLELAKQTGEADQMRTLFEPVNANPSPESTR